MRQKKRSPINPEAIELVGGPRDGERMIWRGDNRFTVRTRKPDPFPYRKELPARDIEVVDGVYERDPDHRWRFLWKGYVE